MSSFLQTFLPTMRRIFILHGNSEGGRKVLMDENFFTGYRRNIIRPEEVLVWIEIPTTSPDEVFKGYKQARRREDDIAIVNAGMFVQFQSGSRKVKDIRLSFGGMAPTTVMATRTRNGLIGKYGSLKFPQ